MEILDKRNKTILKNCKTGDCFVYRSQLYMKIQEIGKYTKVLQFSNGEILENVDSQTEIIQVNAKIIIE